jgi:hypothetical protein
VDQHLVRADAVVEAILEPADRPLEPIVLERRDPAAAVADDVVMVFAARHDRLVAGAAFAGLDALHEPELVEEVEGAVHARRPDAAASGAKAIADLLGGEAAVLAVEELDDGAPGTAASMSGPLERSYRPSGPAAFVDHCHP